MSRLPCAYEVRKAARASHVKDLARKSTHGGSHYDYGGQLPLPISMEIPSWLLQTEHCLIASSLIVVLSTLSEASDVARLDVKVFTQLILEH